eukprot:COSAG06_NODE_4233_length_4446_cov_6.373821_2_plen_95_part_00
MHAEQSRCMLMATMSMTNGSGIRYKRTETNARRTTTEAQRTDRIVSVCTLWNKNLTPAVFVPIDFDYVIYFQPANSEVDLVCELRICPALPSSY